MPRPSKGVRLYKRKARYRNGKVVAQALWIIKDGTRHIATGCVVSPTETKPPQEAEQALADYIAQKYQPERRRQNIEDIDCADVLSIYLSDIGEPGDQFEIDARFERLNEFWGSKKLSVGQCSDLYDLCQASRKPRRCTPRPRDVSSRNQPSCEGGLPPGHGARVATAEGRGPRPVVRAKGSRSADLALLASSGEADNPFGNLKRRPGEHKPPAPETYRQIYFDRPLYGHSGWRDCLSITPCRAWPISRRS